MPTLMSDGVHDAAEADEVSEPDAAGVPELLLLLPQAASARAPAATQRGYLADPEQGRSPSDARRQTCRRESGSTLVGRVGPFSRPARAVSAPIRELDGP